MIEYRDRLAGIEAHEVALSRLVAGIEAARSQQVVRNTVSVDGGTLTVGDGRYDLRVLVVPEPPG